MLHTPQQSGGYGLYGRFFTPTIGAVDEPVAPAVLLLHGIPGTEQNFDVAYNLRQIGINCLLFHYRGCWGSPGKYGIMNLEQDIEAALLWLKAQPTVDPDKIVIVGHSLGGYHTLRLATRAAGISRRERKDAKGRPERDAGDQGEMCDVLTRVKGFCALCPLVGTDSVGVPLSEELSEEFSNFLTNVTGQELREQWAALKSVAEILDEVKDEVEVKEPKLMGLFGKPRKLSKAEESESKKAAADVRRRKLRGGKPLLLITGDVDPLFSTDYYRENLIAPLENTTAFRYDWVRKSQGDHSLARYRKEVVKEVLSFVCACTGHNRWALGERVASVIENAIAYVPWFTFMGIAFGILAGRASVFEEYDALKRQMTGEPPEGQSMFGSLSRRGRDDDDDDDDDDDMD